MNICAEISSYHDVMTNLSDDLNQQEETRNSLQNVNLGDPSYVLRASKLSKLRASELSSPGI
jgi:hypothetical protein